MVLGMPTNISFHQFLTLSKFKQSCHREIHVYPFLKIPTFLSKIIEFSDLKIPQNLRNLLSIFPVDCFLVIKWLLYLRKPSPCPCMLKPFYAVSRVRCCFGYILILSSSGLASEPETQSETGEIMVKVFDTHSK